MGHLVLSLNLSVVCNIASQRDKKTVVNDSEIINGRWGGESGEHLREVESGGKPY